MGGSDEDEEAEGVKSMPLRVISLGWGVQSWTLAAMAALGELEPVDYAIHAGTTHEAEGTYAHAAKWTPWLEEHGVKVVTVKGIRTEVVRQDWSDSTLIPAFTIDKETEKRGQVLRQCTTEWKVRPIRRFLRTVVTASPGAVEMLLGISVDEWRRMRSSDVRYIENVYPLVERRISRADCIAWLEIHDLDVPPKSACTFCPYHSIKGWQELKRVGGPDWQRAVEVDLSIRDKRPAHTLYVHPARRPLAEAINIPEDHGAHQLELEMPCDSGLCFT